MDTVRQMAKQISFDGLSATQSSKTIQVYVRLMFLRIGEIDTLNEKYQAHARIEARWSVETEKIISVISPTDQKQFLQGKSVSLSKYSESQWHPQLFIENAIGDLKEQVTYSAKRSSDQHTYICEQRNIKGLFWEKLELQHFPSDVQDLSISVGSMLYDDKVILMADPHHASGVNREAFVDQQEWSLYQHVDTQQRFVNEFLFEDDDDDDDEEAEEQQQEEENVAETTALPTESTNNKESKVNIVPVVGRKRSMLTITCHAARRSDYFYWNGYCLILFITLVSFAVFAIPPHMVAGRIQTSCTLLLTSITFRWTVNRSLPTISYLTTMDKYAIMCIVSLISLAMWHATIGALLFIYTPDFRATPGMWLTWIDQCAFFTAIALFFCIHILLILWLWLVPFKLRREMELKDVQYQHKLVARRSAPKTLNKKKSKYTPNA